MKCRLFPAPRAIRQLVFAALIGSAALMSAQVGPPQVVSAVKHDTSPPLREMAASPLAQFRALTTPQERFLGRLPQSARTERASQPDAAVQAEVATPPPATLGLNFDGMGSGVDGLTVCCAPPDTNGAVGSTEYVQTVNLSYGVFDKNGNSLHAAIDLSTLFSGFGTVCETGFLSDPVVLYDREANRWVTTYLAAAPIATPPYLAAPFFECMAVSQTNDALGSYNRYAWDLTSLGGLNDYPKLGIWPDGYYTSFNFFAMPSESFLGASPCVFDRAQMIAGGVATRVCFPPDANNFSLLPSDWDGVNPPPAGSPNFLVQFDWNTLSDLNLFKFHVDWVTPANSTFTGPVNIPVTAFSPTCNGGTCIPQSGTATTLDSLADRLTCIIRERISEPGFRV